MKTSKTYIAIPPGETIKEQLQDRGMNQKEFAKRMAMSEKHISKLVNGEVHLTQEMAMRLEMVLGVPARFWNNLEALYREDLERVRMENAMDEDLEFVRKFPYNEMMKNGWVPQTRKPKERVVNLRKFFEVVELDLVMEMDINRIACRRQSETEKADYALTAWAQEAKLCARKMDVAPIDIEGLRKALPRIRAMNLENPRDFSRELQTLLAEFGVALVYLPHIGGSFLHGATFIDGKKIVMGMTVRGKYADKFWFSLFHEIGHILLGHIYQPEGTSEKDEREADAFAAEILIPEKDFAEFVRQHPEPGLGAITEFAREQGLDAGIVVGRLQSRKIVPYNYFNHIKTQYILTSGEDKGEKEEADE